MKPVTATCLLLVIFACPLFCFGQGQNNIWLFGSGRGMDFNAGPPVSYPVNTNMYNSTGTATVCDASGNLLFYACCTEVFNRAHDTMPNGHGLIGSSGAYQGVAIVQSYTNLNQYYVFTVETEFQNRLYYSVVDMTLNAGLGDVIPGEKNIPIDSFVGGKMIALKGATGACYTWLLVHHRDMPEFHAFKISANGLDLTPVISQSGTSGNYEIGDMKVSKNDSSIALINFAGNSYLELHSFNNATGVVANNINIDHTQGESVSFSPDGSKLYMSDGGSLFQYDLSFLPDAAAVYNSKAIVINQQGVQGLRLGPDGKLYFAYDFVSVLTNPNVAWPGCNLTYNLFGMMGSIWGLGNEFVVNPLLGIQSHYTHDTSLCLGFAPVNFSAPNGYGSYLWSDGKTTQVDTFSTAGAKWVMSANCDIRIDTFHVTAIPFLTSSLEKDTTFCFVNNIPVLNAPPGYNNYLWSDGHTTQQDSIGQPGVKWVRIDDTAVCSMMVDTFRVAAHLDTTISTLDTSHCVAYSPITIYAPAGYSSYAWNDGKTTQADTFFTSITKWIIAQNGCSLLIDTVHFNATTIPQDSLTMHSSDTSICFEVASINVSAPPGYTFYLWSDGTAAQNDLFLAPGVKWVYAQKQCQLLIDTFAVQAKLTDTMTARSDTVICFSSLTILSATPGYTNYLWSDGNTTATDTFTSSGVKIAYAHNPCAEKIDTFHAQFINNLSVDLGPDTAICKGETITLNATNPQYNTAKYLWQDGTTTPKYTVTSGGDYSVIVSVGPCSASDTVRVHEKIIDIHLGNGLIPCHQDSIVLDAGVDNATYLWQDGSTQRTYKATKEGSFTVKVTQDDCSASANVAVRFEGCDCIVVLPTAFSPNNDSRNDKFGPLINCPSSSFKLMVYNRWGNQVFYSEDVNSRWDGTVKGIPVDGDTFNYYLEFKDSEGKSYYYKGTVTLVR